MHCEHPIEHLRRHEIVMRTYELDPHDGRLNPTEYKEDKRIKDVQHAHPFVVDRGYPLVKLLHQGEL